MRKLHPEWEINARKVKSIARSNSSPTKEEIAKQEETTPEFQLTKEELAQDPLELFDLLEQRGKGLALSLFSLSLFLSFSFFFFFFFFFFLSSSLSFSSFFFSFFSFFSFLFFFFSFSPLLHHILLAELLAQYLKLFIRRQDRLLPLNWYLTFNLKLKNKYKNFFF